MKKICVINTGGDIALRDYIAGQTESFDVCLDFLFSSDEGEIIDKIHECYFKKFGGIIIDAGEPAEYSYAIRDAVSAVLPIPTVEIRNGKCENESVIAPVCKGQIRGIGDYAYVLAIKYLGELTK